MTDDERREVMGQDNAMDVSPSWQELRDERDRLRDALAELLRVDDDWHGSVNSEMASARSKVRAALKEVSDGNG